MTIGNSDVFAETKLDADAAAKLVDHEVAVVGMGPIVSKNVTVDDLTLEQLKGIFGGTITNWSEVGGEDAEIVVVNRKEGSGTRATFEAAVFGEEKNPYKPAQPEQDKSGGEEKNPYKPAQPEQDKSGDVQTLMGSTDNAISYIDFSHFDDSKFTAIKVGGVDKSGDVQTLMGSTDNAISYIDFSHFDDSKFTAIKVGGVEPASENVLDNSFPIWATEHMYCAKDADDATKAFLEYMLSDDVQGLRRRPHRRVLRHRDHRQLRCLRRDQARRRCRRQARRPRGRRRGYGPDCLQERHRR